MRILLFSFGAVCIASLLVCGQMQTGPAAGPQVGPLDVPVPIVFAYIDPGTASLLFQSLIAGLLGIVFAFKRVRDYVSAFFGKLFRRKAKESAAEAPATGSPAEAQAAPCASCPSCQASKDADKDKPA